MYERILVATDGSELSEQAVTAAIDLALLTQSELFAVKVSHHQPLHRGETPCRKCQRDNFLRAW